MLVQSYAAKGISVMLKSLAERNKDSGGECREVSGLKRDKPYFEQTAAEHPFIR